MSGFVAGLSTAGAMLNNKPFRRLVAAQFSAVAMTYSLSLVGVVLVEETTHSSVQTGVVILSSILPAFLASLFAGAVVDRRGRIPVLVVSYLAQSLMALIFWGGARSSSLTLMRVVVCVANMGAAVSTQFTLTAQLALLPDLVDKAHLMTANTLFQIVMVAAEGLGVAVLGPMVIELAGFSAVGVVGALLCLLALALVATLPRGCFRVAPGQRRITTWRGLGADLQAGWRTIAHDRLLSLVVIQITLAGMLLLVLMAIAPGLILRELGLGSDAVPLLALGGGLGFALGAVLMGRWEQHTSRPVWIAAGLGVFGLSVGLVSLFSGEAAQHHGWLMAPQILAAGVGLALVIIPARTILQERPPPALRGRVIAAQLALANAASVVALLMGGSLADHLGVRPVMGMVGLLALGVSAVSLSTVRGQSREFEK